MRRVRARLIFLFLFVLACLEAPARAETDDRRANGRVRVVYWEMWTGFEKDAMQAVVDDFNRSQERIYVELVSVSGIRQKTLIATAGGNPPDLAGLQDDYIIEFANKNALLPLEEFAKGTEIVAERYIPVYWNMANYGGHLWAVPTTPVVIGLFWNKDLFRNAGLDPERPPRTIAELDAFAKRLTRRNPTTGELEVMGFLHSEPNFWPYAWGYFFGGKLWDGGANLTLDSPENIRAYEWVQGYAREYGVDTLQTLRSSFGAFASPQNAFISGKVAMELQGVYMGNFIARYNPGMHWGAAPFPSANEGTAPVAFAMSNMLAIPNGARHPKEAFEFMKYVAQQGPLEKLCAAHSKNSPLADVSAGFLRDHSNAYIGMFQELARSPNTTPFPFMAVWRQYRDELINAFERIWLLQATPAEALSDAKVRAQFAWDRERERQTRAARSGPVPWLAWAPLALVGSIVAIVMGLCLRAYRKARAAAAGTKPSRVSAALARGLLFFSPWLVGLLVFVLYPIASSIVYSFCDYSVLMEPRFVGLLNYRDLLTDDVFWVAIKNTAIYAALALPLGLFVAFSLALFLSSNVKGTGVYRTLLFVPSLTPLVASAMVWLWIFNSKFGVLNHLLSKITFGLVHNVPWLNEARFAMPSLVMMSLWGVGHTVVVMSAAMQEVPASVYEAADIDGASLLQKVRHITLPMISPVLYFNAVLGIIGVLQVFAIPYIMTNGGPTRSTYFYAMYLYDNAFSFLRMGYACAMAWILFLIILALTAVAVRAGKNRVHYTT
jgi:multiple sugar transport system substrate-binding protein